MIGERSLEVTLVKTGKRLQWVDSNRSSVTTEGPLSAGSGPRAMTLRQLVAQHLRKGAVLVVGGFHLATDAHVRACATNNRNQ